MKKILLFILAIGIANCIDAQNQAAIFGAKGDNFESKIYDAKCDVPRTIDNATADKIKALIRKSLGNYYRLGHLWDPNDNYAVTQESVTKFNELFDDNTKVLSDIAKYNGIIISSENYSSSVLDYLTAVGIDFDIPSAVVDKIREDKAGYYKVEILLTKVLFNGLDNDNSQFRCKSGRKFELIMNYRIDKDDLTRAYISNISGSLIKDCEDAHPKWGYYAGVEMGLPTANTTDFFNENMSTLTVTSSPVIMGSVGAFYLKPITTKEKTFLNFGLQIGYASIKTTISPNEYVQKNVLHAFNGDNNGLYSAFDRRVVIEKQFVENHGAINVAIPLGIRQLVKTNNNETFRISLQAMVVPTFQIFSLTKWKGRMSYYGDFAFLNGKNGTIADVDLSKEGIENTAFGLRKNVYFQSSDKSDVSTGVQVEKPSSVGLKFHPSFIVSVSPILEFNLSQTTSLTIAPTVGYTLNSFVKSNDSNKLLFMGTPVVDGGVQDRINEGITSSVVEDYISAYKLLTFGVHVGMLYKLK